MRHRTLFTNWLDIALNGFVDCLKKSNLCLKKQKYDMIMLHFFSVFKSTRVYKNKYDYMVYRRIEAKERVKVCFIIVIFFSLTCYYYFFRLKQNLCAPLMKTFVSSGSVWRTKSQNISQMIFKSSFYLFVFRCLFYDWRVLIKFS